MTVKKDNHIDPEKKARWGFSGEPGSITVGPQTVGETGGVDHARTRAGEGAARSNGGGDDPSLEAIQLDAVSKLAEGLESGQLNPVESEGPAMRLYKVLEGIQEGMKGMADERDESQRRAEELQRQLDDLKAEAEKSRLASEDAEELASLKAKLDAAGVTYRANASKESLQKQVAELPKS